MRLLRTDGTSLDLGPFDMNVVRKHLTDPGLSALSDGRYLICEDNGHAEGLPVNEQATAVYRATATSKTNYVVVGDVVVCEKGEVT